MLVKLSTCRVSAAGVQYPGDTIDLPDAEALRLVEAGSAERISEAKATPVAAPVQSAVIETAAVRSAVPGRKPRRA
jgi:hypothetical protein